MVHAGDPAPSAVDIATARDLFRDGARLASEEKWEAALDAYQRSMALRPSSLTRYSIAVVQERLGKLVEAMENLREFVASDHDSTTRRYVPTASDMLRDMERRIGRIKVVIPGNPRGAEVRIDNTPIPEAAIGVHRPTDPGDRKVEARVPGYAPFVKEVDLKEGESIEIVVRLSEAEGRVEEASTNSTVSSSIDTAPESGNSTAMILTLGGAGVFAAGLGVGIFGYAKAKSAETDDSSDADTARTMALVGDIGMGVGLVAAGVGTYLLLSGGKPDTSANVRVSPWAGAGAGGITAGGRF